MIRSLVIGALRRPAAIVVVVILLIALLSTSVSAQTSSVTSRTLQALSGATTQQASEPTAAEPVSQPVSTNGEPLPTTGPAETLSALLGILAVGLGVKQFLRSKTNFSRSVLSMR